MPSPTITRTLSRTLLSLLNLLIVDTLECVSPKSHPILSQKRDTSMKFRKASLTPAVVRYKLPMRPRRTAPAAPWPVSPYPGCPSVSSRHWRFRRHGPVVLKNLPQFGVAWWFLIVRFRLCIWGQEYPRGDAVSFWRHHIRDPWHHLWSTNDEVNFDHLGKGGVLQGSPP